VRPTPQIKFDSILVYQKQNGTAIFKISSRSF
jgi:hypothetical protein